MSSGIRNASLALSFLLFSSLLLSSPPRYELLGLLGGGSTGEVFLAKRDDGATVAVKRLFPGDDSVIPAKSFFAEE